MDFEPLNTVSNQNFHYGRVFIFFSFRKCPFDNCFEGEAENEDGLIDENLSRKLAANHNDISIIKTIIINQYLPRFYLHVIEIDIYGRNNLVRTFNSVYLGRLNTYRYCATLYFYDFIFNICLFVFIIQIGIRIVTEKHILTKNFL